MSTSEQPTTPQALPRPAAPPARRPRPVLRAAAETAMVFGLLGWLYVACVAATRPGALSEAVAAVLPVRRDTFGVFCFGCSALAAFALHTRTGSFWTRRPGRPGGREAALRTVLGYGVLAWAYLCVNNLTHPATTGARLTHFAATPSEGTAAVACFAAAAAALFLLRRRGRAADV